MTLPEIIYSSLETSSSYPLHLVQLFEIPFCLLDGWLPASWIIELKPIRSLKVLSWIWLNLADLVSAMESAGSFRDLLKHETRALYPQTFWSSVVFRSALGKLLYVLSSALFASSSWSNWLASQFPIWLKTSALGSVPRFHVGNDQWLSLEFSIVWNPSLQSLFLGVCWFSPFPNPQIPHWELLVVTSWKTGLSFRSYWVRLKLDWV